MVGKTSEKEEEYFARMEFERRKKIMEEGKKTTEEGKRKLKELHYMRCPKCGMELIEIAYRGIKIDEWSECKGIWLDAGELEVVAKLEKSGLDKFFSILKK